MRKIFKLLVLGFATTVVTFAAISLYSDLAEEISKDDFWEEDDCGWC